MYNYDVVQGQSLWWGMGVRGLGQTLEAKPFLFHGVILTRKQWAFLGNQRENRFKTIIMMLCQFDCKLL